MKPETETFIENTFVTPTTVDRAYKLGLRSAEAGYERIPHALFFSKIPEGETIPYQSSVYRAYRYGFTEGRYRRSKRLVGDVPVEDIDSALAFRAARPVRE